MAKLTLDEKIARTQELIAKEEKIIESSREKIKTLNAELKELTTEKEKSFANDMLKFMKDNGLSPEQIKKMFQEKAAESAAVVEGA